MSQGTAISGVAGPPGGFEQNKVTANLLNGNGIAVSKGEIVELGYSGDTAGLGINKALLYPNTVGTAEATALDGEFYAVVLEDAATTDAVIKVGVVGRFDVQVVTGPTGGGTDNIILTGSGLVVNYGAVAAGPDGAMTKAVTGVAGQKILGFVTGQIVAEATTTPVLVSAEFNGMSGFGVAP